MARPEWVDRKCIKTGEDSSRCRSKWTCGEGNIGYEEVMGRYGARTSNKEGLIVVGFPKRMNLEVVNTYFKKKDEHNVTYKSGEKYTQVDYVMCGRRNLKEMCDCRVMVNQCFTEKGTEIKAKDKILKTEEASSQEAFR